MNSTVLEKFLKMVDKVELVFVEIDGVFIEVSPTTARNLLESRAAKKIKSTLTLRRNALIISRG